MSEPARDDDAALLPPMTGHGGVDAALAQLADAGDLTPAAWLERLGVAHEALQAVLHDSAQAPLPAQPRDAHGRAVPGPVRR